MIIPLGLLLPEASSGLTRRYGSSRPITSLFGLAPGRVCHAIFVTKDAVGSYPSVSPLPLTHRSITERRINGGIFSVALSVTCYSAWPLTSTLLFGARTFLPQTTFVAHQRSSVLRGPLVTQVVTTLLLKPDLFERLLN